MSNNALTIRQPLTPQVWQMITSIAPAMHQSRIFGVSSPEQAMAIMLKGHELGLPLTASFEFIHLIQGKPTLSPRGALALIHDHPDNAGISVQRFSDAKSGAFLGYEVTMKRKSGFEHTVRFTLEDAKRAGLIKKDSAWESYPENMCKWRAIGFCADAVFPDVIGGLKRADEFGAQITPDGEVIDGEWTRGDPLLPPQSDPVVTPLDALVEKYGAEAVIQANGGNIPATPEEVTAVAEKLNGGGNG